MIIHLRKIKNKHKMNFICHMINKNQIKFNMINKININ